MYQIVSEQAVIGYFLCIVNIFATVLVWYYNWRATEPIYHLSVIDETISRPKMNMLAIWVDIIHQLNAKSW